MILTILDLRISGMIGSSDRIKIRKKGDFLPYYTGRVFDVSNADCCKPIKQISLESDCLEVIV